jgi:YidC/Oxa1 family membrane protein insertase
VATIQSAEVTTKTGRKPTPISRIGLRWAAIALLFVMAGFAVAACGTARADSGPTATPQASQAAVASAPAAVVSATSPQPSPTPEPEPLVPASPGADPMSLISWLFTPMFQALFLLLTGLYAVTGNIVVAIVLMTLVIKLVTFRLASKQIISQQRMQRLQPELKALQKETQRRYKGDRVAVQKAQQDFYKERGVSPTAGCLPSILQMGMLIPMYSVIRIGLTNFNPSAMLTVFGVKVVPITCPNPSHIVNGIVDKSQPCINTVVAGLDMGKEQVLFSLPLLINGWVLGVSALALVAAALQMVQSRMMMPPAVENDPSASSQRTMMIFMPLISIVYGGILPAGLFIYWIVQSLFSIGQQFLIIGWGSMFPLFGWSPAFARNHTPMFPVTMPEPAEAGKSLAASRHKPEERWASAASTVRPNTQKRSSRRGRRR